MSGPTKALNHDAVSMNVFDGVRVVEVCIYAFGPAAAAVMCDWGADVVKVEHPTRGDPLRGIASWNVPPGTGGVTYLWEVCNRGKRSVGVDLSTPDGHEILMELIEQSDVFITNFLPAARRRLGIDVEDVRRRNPRIVYARGSAHGTKGAEAERGGFDGTTYWHRTGMGSALTAEGCHPPDLPGPAFGDIQSGMHLAGGIAAALYHRERTGHALVVDTSLLGSGLWAMQASIAAASVTGRATLERASRTDPPNPLSNIYATADGRFVCLAMLESDRYWSTFCRTIGRPSLASDPRFATAADRDANAESCVAELSAILRARTLEEWMPILSQQDGPWTVVNRVGDVAADRQAFDNGYIHQFDIGGPRPLRLVDPPVQFDETPACLRRAPEHAAATEEVLLELGHRWDEIISLKGKGVIA
jgi:crotonobetainyl-CoA:carnitine CoA-transferase CaiB-like acyl-CoA transferase